MDGAIGPAFTDYLKRGLKKSGDEGAQLLLIELDTPGGLLTSTRDMVSLITEAPLPVAVYVTPTGAHAASAGTFLLYASHIAAMDQGTNVGAATPVNMKTQLGDKPASKDEEKSAAEDRNAQALERKAMEDTLAFIRGLAELRGRNADFAADAVKEAKSLTASEALKENVIEYVAESRGDLLKQIDGKKVPLKSGRSVKLDTADAPVIDYAPDWRTTILSIMTDPNIAVILMSIGVYGLILEFYNPGSLIPGTIGAVCLIAGLFAMNVLPINAAGIVLILLGAGFIVAEMFVPSFGILGFCGLAAFVFGAAILVDTDGLLGIGLDHGVIAGLAVLGALIVGTCIWLTAKVIRKGETVGAESLIGEPAYVVEWNGISGRVRAQGEVWSAYSDMPLTPAAEEKLTVSRVDALKLKVIKS
jgi:membrane-bound serine protease (ClpP class)